MIVFEANYSKKLGLPGYSSHQYSVTIRTELADINQANEQSEAIHALLQAAVDREIQKTGYLPSSQQPDPLPVNGNNGHINGAQANGRTNGSYPGPQNGNGYRQRQNGYRNGHQNHRNQMEHWKCSPKQQDLILKIVHENRLDKQQVEELSQQLFGIGVRQLNKLQASGLIDELIQQQESRNFNPVMAGGQR